MKTSFVSTSAISQAMRYSMLRSQSDLVKAQKEVSTGRVADVGLALGSRSAQSVTFSRDVERLNGIVDSNALVSSRLSSTQKALGQMSTAANDFLSTLTASASGDAAAKITQASARGVLDALTSIANTSVNGEYLFAGTNTDVRPLNDFNAAGSPAKAAFDAAFLGHFGFTQNDAAAASITGAQMDTFVTNVVEPMFMGPGWAGDFSNATDQKIVSRVALNETVETSVSANENGIRRLVMVAATLSDLMGSNISVAARETLTSKAVSMVGEAVSELANLQAKTGIVEKRVIDASDRIKVQVDLFERHILDMEGVDPYEASTRVADLLAHIETSYALTARMQQLSLLKFVT